MINKKLNNRIAISLIAVVLSIMMALSVTFVGLYSKNNPITGGNSENGMNDEGYFTAPTAGSGATLISTEAQLKAWLLLTGTNAAYKEGVLSSDVTFTHDGNYQLASDRILHGAGKTITLTDVVTSSVKATSAFNSATGYLTSVSVQAGDFTKQVTARGSFLYMNQGTITGVNFNAVNINVDVNDATDSGQNGNHNAHGIVVGLNLGVINQVNLNMTGTYRAKRLDTRGTCVGVGGIAGFNRDHSNNGKGHIQDCNVVYGNETTGASLQALAQSFIKEGQCNAMIGGIVGFADDFSSIVNVQVEIKKGANYSGSQYAFYAEAAFESGVRGSQAFAGGIIGLSRSEESSSLDGAIYTDNSTSTSTLGNRSIHVQNKSGFSGAPLAKGMFYGYFTPPSSGFKNQNFFSGNNFDTNLGNGASHVIVFGVITGGTMKFVPGDMTRVRFDTFASRNDDSMIYWVQLKNGGTINKTVETFRTYKKGDRHAYVDKAVLSSVTRTEIKVVCAEAKAHTPVTRPADVVIEYGTKHTLDPNTVFNSSSIVGYNASNSMIEYKFQKVGSSDVFASTDILDVGEYNIVIDDTKQFLYHSKTGSVNMVHSFTNISDYTREKVIVEPKKIDVSSVTWNYNDTTNFVYDGSSKSVGIVGLDSNLNVNYTGTYSAVNANENYQATANISPKNNNYAVTGTTPAPLNWKIKKATYKLNIVFKDKSVVYSSSPRTLNYTGTLPAGVSARYEGGNNTTLDGFTDVVTDLQISLILTGDEMNYEPIPTKYAKLTITPQPIDVSSTVWTYANDSVYDPAKPYIYDNRPKEVKLGSLPEHVAVTYDKRNNIRFAAGDFTSTATVTVLNDNTNYSIAGVAPTLDWKIAHATYDMSGVKFEAPADLKYTGETYPVLISGNLPTGYDETTDKVSVEYKDASGAVFNGITHVAQSGKITAFFTSESLNFNAIPSITIDLVMIAQDIILPAIEWTVPEFTYLGTPQQVTINQSESTIPNTKFKIEGDSATLAGNHTTTITIDPASTDYVVVGTNAFTREWSIGLATYDMSKTLFDTVTYEYNGTPQCVSITGEMPVGYTADDAVTVVYSGGSNTEQNGITNFAEHNTEIIATFTGSANYNKIEVMRTNIGMTQATYDMTGVALNGADLTYNEVEQYVTITGDLPSGYVLAIDQLKLTYTGGENGTNGFTNVANSNVTLVATFTVSGNYYAVEPLTASVTMKEKSIDVSGVAWVNVDPSVYTGIEQVRTLNSVGLALTHVTLELTGDKATDANVGEATYTAHANIIADTNYVITGTVADINWVITRATYDMSGVTFNGVTHTYNTSMQYVLIEGTLPTGANPLVDSVTVEYTNEINSNRNGITDVAESGLLVTATFTGSTNYNIILVKTATISMNPGKITLFGVRWDSNTTTTTYDGTLKTAYINKTEETLPNTTITYIKNTATNAGFHDISVSIEANTNYILDGNQVEDSFLNITKNTYVMTGITFDSATKTYNTAMQYFEIAGTLPTGANPEMDQVKVTYAGGQGTLFNGITNVNEGNVTITANFTGSTNYNDITLAFESTFAITPDEIDVSGYTWDYTADKFTYTGGEQTVAITDINELVTITYTNATKINASEGSLAYTAEAVATVKDNKANYSIIGAITSIEWNINKGDYVFGEITFENISAVYDSNEHSVSIDETTLPNGANPDGTDKVSVSYVGGSNTAKNGITNVDESIATITATFTGSANYNIITISKVATITITPEVISLAGVAWSETNAIEYTGAEIAMELNEVGKALKNVTISYPTNKATNASAEGTTYPASVVIEPINTNYIINDAKIADTTWTISKATYITTGIKFVDVSHVYTGDMQYIIATGLPTGANPSVDQVKVTYAGGQGELFNGITTAVESGVSITATFTGSANYNDISIVKVATIYMTGMPVSLTGVDWNSKLASQLYTGDLKTVSLNQAGLDLVTAGKITIEYGKIYQATVVDASGYEATVTVSACDNYIITDNSITNLTWYITKNKYNVTGVEFASPSFTYNGKTQYAVVANLPSNLTVNYSNGTTAKNGITDVADSGRVITATYVGDFDNYISIDDITATITMIAAEVNIDWSTNDAGAYSFVYSGADQSSKVTANYVPVNNEIASGSMTVTPPTGGFINVAGGVAYEFTATLSDDNFVVATGATSKQSYTITKASIDINNLKWQSNTALSYNGLEQTVLLANVPSTITVKYTSNKGTDVGTYNAKAELTIVADTEGNYEIIGGAGSATSELTWTIVQGLFDWSSVAFTSEPLEFTGFTQTILAAFEEAVVGGGVISVEYLHNTFTSVSDSGKATANFSFINAGYSNTTHSIEINVVVMPKAVDITWSAGTVSNDRFEYNTLNQFDKVIANYPTVGEGTADGKLDITIIDFTNADVNAYEFVGSLTDTNYVISGNATGVITCTKNYYMNAKSISLAGVSWDETKKIHTYNGEVKTVTLNATGLALENVDIVYKGETATAAKDNYVASVVITAKPNYVVDDAQLENFTWTILKGTHIVDNITFTGASFGYVEGTVNEISVTGTPVDGVYITYTGGENSTNGVTNVPVGGVTTITAHFNVSDTTNYNEITTTLTADITMTAQDIIVSGYEWTYTVGEYTYNGSVKTVAINVTEIPNAVITYSGNVAETLANEKYTAKVAITVLDDSLNYKIVGTIADLNWAIAKANHIISHITFADGTFGYVEGAVNEIVVTGATPEGVSVAYTGGENGTNGVTNVNALGYTTITASFIVDDTANYNAITTTLEAKIIITAVEINIGDYTWTYTAGEFTYNGSVKTVAINVTEIPNAVITYSGNVAETLANEKYTAKVAITVLDDSLNYKIVGTIADLNWAIAKANHIMTGVEFANGDFTYNGAEQTVSISGTELPEGVSVSYTDGTNAVNGITNVADSGKVITANFTIADTDNYNAIEPMTSTITMEAFGIDILWSEKNNFTNDGTDHSSKITASYKAFEGKVDLVPTTTDGAMVKYKKGGYTFTITVNSNYIVANEEGGLFNVYNVAPIQEVLDPSDITATYTKNSITVKVDTDKLDLVEYAIVDNGTTVFISNGGLFTGLNELTEYIIKVRIKGDADSGILPSKIVTINVTTFYIVSDYNLEKENVGTVTFDSYDNIVALIATYNKLSDVDKASTKADLDGVVAEYNTIITTINNELEISKNVANNSALPIALAVTFISILALAGIAIKKVGGTL